MTEQPIKVLEVVFGFLCGFLTKFLLHFIDVHRYASPATKADYLCIRSLRKLRAFALGSSFTPLPLVWTAFPSSDYYANSVRHNSCQRDVRSARYTIDYYETRTCAY